MRIKNLSCDDETLYTYNTNCKLSQLLLKTTNGVVTKYVYGIGLIGEEREGNFKTYHFDYRGSTVAITDECGCITDTFKYDTYGNITERTGNSKVIFGYNGRDGVVTDENGLIYMRARYYSPKMRRFINADVIHGEISDSTSLNRYSYVNGNPVSFVDPFGLAVEERANMLTDSLRTIIDVLSTSTGLESKKKIGNIEYYSKIKTVHGNGSIDFEGILDEQLDLLNSVTISSETASVLFSDDSFGTEASVELNKTNVLSIALINGLNYTGVEFTIKTKVGKNNSVSTTLGVKINSSTKKPNSTPEYAFIPEFNLVPIQPILPDWNSSATTAAFGVTATTEILLALILLAACIA